MFERQQNQWTRRLLRKLSSIWKIIPMKWRVEFHLKSQYLIKGVQNIKTWTSAVQFSIFFAFLSLTFFFLFEFIKSISSFSEHMCKINQELKGSMFSQVTVVYEDNIRCWKQRNLWENLLDCCYCLIERYGNYGVKLKICIYISIHRKETRVGKGTVNAVLIAASHVVSATFFLPWCIFIRALVHRLA